MIILKSYKKLILASLASAAILSTYSIEDQAAAEAPVIDPANETGQVAAPPKAVAAVEAPTAVADVTSVTAQTDADNLERANDPAYLEENLTTNDGGKYDAQGNLTGLTIGGETAEVTQEKPEVLPAPVNDSPNRISTNLSQTPSTSMLFQWHTTTPDSDARLYVWEDGRDETDIVAYTPEMVTIDDAFHIQTTPDGHYVYAILEGFDSKDSNPFRAVDGSDTPIGYYTDEVFTAENIQWLDKGYDNWSIALPYEQFKETAYRVEATNLRPGTTYKYQMGNPTTGLISEIGIFTTASADQKPFSFIHYTDTEAAFSSDNQRPEWAYTQNTLESAMAVAPDAAFAVHTGNIVNDQWNDTEWLKTLAAIEPLNQAMPHMYVTGNHDRENFLAHINTPNEIEGMESGAAYSLDYNEVHFVVLNTEHDRDRADGEEKKAILDSQMQWLHNDLAEARAERDAGNIDWIIVSYHRPLFSASYHSLEDETVQLVRDELMKVLDQYDVDLVLNGHDHNLTVTQPLLHDTGAFGNAHVDGSQVVTENGVTTYYNPEGTVFFIPNTAGTKTYEAIYNNKSMEWILENEDIDETYLELFGYEVTEEDFEYFRSLLLTDEQSFRSSYYSDGHSNAREANIQHYAVIDVTSDEIIYKLYEVVGEDLEAEGGRETNLVHTYIISKKAAPQTGNLGTNNGTGADEDTSRDTDANNGLGESTDTGKNTEPDTDNTTETDATTDAHTETEAVTDANVTLDVNSENDSDTDHDSESNSDSDTAEDALPQTGASSGLALSAATILAGLGLTGISRRRTTK